MHRVKTSPSRPVTSPSQSRLKTPSASQANPQPHTVSKAILPEGTGRSLRYSRSNSASKASFKNMPPTYRQVAPANRNGSFWIFPPPPNHQPARQFDQTVGKFETRPRTRSVRNKDIDRG